MERKNYLDFLKGISIFAVIIIHVTTEGLSRELSNADFVWYNLFYILARFSVPVFIMVTGVLLLSPNRELPIKKVYSKYVLNIIVAAFLWGIVYKLIHILTSGGISENGGILAVIKSYLVEFVTGDLEFHFWYVYVVLGIYIALPILRAFVKSADRKTIEYFILIWIIINGILVITQSGYFTFLASISDNFHFVGIFVSFMGYTILGYYLDTFELDKIQKVAVVVVGIVGFIVCAGLTIYDSLTIGKPRIEYTSYICPGIVFFATMIFIMFKNTKWKYSSLFNKLVCRIGRNTLGIYFMHMIFIVIFLRSRIITDLIYAPIDIVIYSLVILFLSWGLQEILGRIPIVGRWL